MSELSLVEALATALPAVAADDEVGTGLALISRVVARARVDAPCIIVDEFLATHESEVVAVLSPVITAAHQLVKSGLLPGTAKTTQLGPKMETIDARAIHAGAVPSADTATLQRLCAAFTNDASRLAVAPVYHFPPARPWPC